MYQYFCYGLHIASELEMPELRVAHSPSSPDVLIRLGSLSSNGLDESLRQNGNLWIGNNVLRLHVPEVARFEISDGKQIIVDALPAASPGDVRLFLQGSALGAMLHQRGHLVLHGNAIRFGDACMVCVGHSGSGKSTLAATLLQHGHDILADDVTPITSGNLALPGFPRIKLWQDAANNLGISTAPLTRILHRMDKYNLPLSVEETTDTPLPIRWVYVLEWSDVSELTFVPVEGAARFALLREHTYRLHYLKGGERLQQHMMQCAQLSRHIQLVRVLRPQVKTLSAEYTAARLIAHIT